MTEHLIPLPYERPLITSNQRVHYHVKNERTQQIRTMAKIQCRRFKIPRINRADVEIHWEPPDHRRRDAGCLSLTLKAALDGIVDAGVLVDDSSDYVPSETCRIHRPRERNGTPGPRMWIVLHVIDDEEVAAA